MVLIKLFDTSNNNDNIINYYNTINKYGNNYEQTFSYKFDFIDILNHKYNNRGSDIPFVIWEKRKCGSSVSKENVHNEDVRNSYKIVSSYNEYYDDNYVTLKDKEKDEIYVSIYDPSNYYTTTSYSYKSNTLSKPLKENLLTLNKYLTELYGSNFKDEAKDNYIYFDNSEYNSEYRGTYRTNHETFKRNWKVHKYEKGGFFKSHSDSKINEHHIGTLVLIPPTNYSLYLGGKLILYNMKNDTEIEMEVEPNNEGWMCVFIPIGQKHEITEVIEGTRYSFTSPYFISKVTKINMSSCVYSQASIEKQLSDMLVESSSNDVKNELTNIDKQIEQLLLKKNSLLKIVESNKYDDIVNKKTEKMIDFNNTITENIKTKTPFIIILETFYVNPTPESFTLNDMLYFNSIFELSNSFSSKENHITPKVKFMNRCIHMNAGYSSNDVYDCDDVEPDEFWGIDNENNVYDWDDYEQIRFNKDIINGSMFLELTRTNTFHSREENNRIMNSNYGLYYQYNNYVCYYNGNKMPGKYEYTESDYNDEYYIIDKSCNVTIMIVEF